MVSGCGDLVLPGAHDSIIGPQNCSFDNEIYDRGNGRKGFWMLTKYTFAPFRWGCFTSKEQGESSQGAVFALEPLHERRQSHNIDESVKEIYVYYGKGR